MTSPSTLAVAVVALALACQPQGGESTAVFTSTPPTSSTGDDSTTGEPGSTSAVATGTADASTGEPTTSTSGNSGASTYDVGAHDLGDGPPIGCQGKIDFVFVISTAKDKQEALIASFPGFAETIAIAFADFDYHIIFPNPRPNWGDVVNCPIGLEGCYKADEPCAGLDDPTYPCWAHFTKDALGPCDSTQGAGVVFPAGFGATNHPCKFAGGERYIQKDEPDLAAAFACAAQNLTGEGGFVPAAWATIQALSPEMNEPGGCNEGFVRDDALLVIVLITDFDDLASPYNPLPWAQMIESAKGGRQDGVVFLGLLFDSDLPLSEQYCMSVQNPQEGRLVTWMKYFEHYKWGSICMPDYTAFLAEAAEYVLDICAVYVPQ